MRLRISRLSSVNTFKRTTQGLLNPAAATQEIVESVGQRSWTEVIIAIKVCPWRLKVR
jgi:hypothetical protein